MSTATVATIDTPDGPFTIIVNDTGAVLASGWSSDPDEVLHRIAAAHRPSQVVPAEAQDALDAQGTPDASAPADTAIAAVRAYYTGAYEAPLEVPVVQYGTALQQRGWAALRTITAGQPLSYTEFAVQLGQPGAVRPAASVCARNAPALFVPCHRVLRADGSLGGFAWGGAVKQALLDREASGNTASGSLGS